MIRQILAAIIGISTLSASTAFATGTTKACTPGKVAGSYIHRRVDPDTGFAFIDQIIVNRDGTAYWNQSTQFERLMTTGSVLESIGTWKCINDSTLIMTTISAVYRSEGVPDPFQIGELVPDLVTDLWERETQRFHVVNKNTLERTFVIFKQFGLGDDPLSTSANPINEFISDSSRIYGRVPVLTSDIP
jgi:hypothetical protein